MPLLSQPWADPVWQSSRVVARQGSLPAGVAYSMLQGIFFLGPFALGALAWETCSGIPGDVHTALQYASAHRDRRPANAWSVAARLTASLARIMALCFLAIYISYTHGATDLACQGWPRAIAAMSALALSFSVICFILKAIGTARLNKIELGVLGSLALAQLIVPLVSVHSWTGALSLPARRSCYLRIQSWFAIFSLLPLITLTVVLGMLVAGQTNEKYRFSSYIGQRTSLASSRSSRPVSSGTAQSNDSPPRPISDQSRIHAERLYLKNQSSSHFRRAGSPEEANIQESFLRLTGEDGESVVERDTDRKQKVNMFFIRFGTLWGLSWLTLLAGTIIAFMNPSPILTFMYQPILTILPVLCASRLASLHFGRTNRRSVSDPSSQRSLNSSQKDVNLTEKGLAPEPFALRSSISPIQPASVRSQSRGGRVTPGHNRARSLLHYMSARSLRDQIQGYRKHDQEDDPDRPPSSLKGQISYPYTPESMTMALGQTPTSMAMSRAHSEGPRLTFAPESDMLMTMGLPSLRSMDNLNWTPRSAPLGLTPQPARRKLPSLTTSISDRSSGDATDALQSPRKAPFNLLTPPIEQRFSTKGTSNRLSGTSSVDRNSTALRNLPSPNDGSNKPSNSWPASSDSEARGENVSTRRSSDLEAKEADEVNELRNIGEVDEMTPSEPKRQSQRASFAEMSLDNPRDRSIELSSVDGDHQRSTMAALLGIQDDKAAVQRPRTAESSIRPLTAPREPSIRSVAVSIEDADEDDLKQVIDSRGFAKTAPAHGLSKEEKFQRALSLRAGEKGKKTAATTGQMDDQAVASGSADGTAPGAQTEASFGAAEISHNPRLKRLDSMGKKPRTNPFWPYRQPKLTEDDRKSSDQSGSSGPSQVTGITSSSGGSGSASGSGSDNSRVTNVSRTHANRVGVGERGGAPSPIKQVGKSWKHPPVTGVTSKDTKYSAKSKVSLQSSDGGKSAESNGTFGMKSSDPR